MIIRARNAWICTSTEKEKKIEKNKQTKTTTRKQRNKLVEI